MTVNTAVLDKMTLNGVEYVRSDSVNNKPANVKRAVIVVDRGWIVAGDVTEENGRIKLGRALHVFSWSEIGFSGMVYDPKSKKVNLKKLPDGFDMPSDAEVFRMWVSDDWGL